MHHCKTIPRIRVLAARCCLALLGAAASRPTRGLVGAWRSNLEFQTGTFASIKDLAFLYVFNEGGTMTESSWLPSGYGVFTESLQLAADGQSFTSTIAYEAFDASGKQGPDSGRATARGVRFAF